MNLDEEPVGRHKELGVSEHPSSSIESSESSKIDSLMERTLSRDSKTRLAAMPELLNLLSTGDAEASLEYCPHFPKYLGDAHPKVQELACQCLLALAAKCPPAPDKMLLEAAVAVLEKCITSNKEQLKSKGMECMLKLAENGNVHLMIKEMLSKRLSLKASPKVSAAALYTLATLLENFGATHFPVREFVEAATDLAASNNTYTRIRALDYLKEGYKWDKSVVASAIERLKPSQREELKKQFVEKGEAPKPLRTATKAPASEESKKSNVEAPPTANKFNEHWCTQLAEKKKWSDKRDMLEDLVHSIPTSKIRAEVLPELAKALKSLLQDSNLIVSSLALRSLGELAKEFKTQFANSAKQVFELVVQKCKDKKSGDEAQKCLENLVFALRLEEMVEPIKEALGNKSPLVKAKVCAWLASAVVPRVEVALAKTMGTALGPSLSKLTDDASSEVRDAALSCIAAIKSHIGADAKMDRVITALSPHKQERLEKFTEQMSCTRVVSDDTNVLTTQSMIEEVKTAAGSYSSADVRRSSVRKRQQKAHFPVASAKAPAKRKINYEVITEEDIGPAISGGNATKQVFESIPTMILAQFDMTEWKERRKGFALLNEWVQSNPDKAQGMVEALVVWLERKFNYFRDESDESLKELVLLFKTVCDKCVVNKRFAYETVPVLAEQMKNESELTACIETVLAIAKSANPSYVAALCIKTCSNSNPKVMNGGVLLLSKLLETYGAGLLPVKVTIEYAKECLNYPLAADAAVEYIKAIHKVMGDSIKAWLEDLDKEHCALLEGIFEGAGSEMEKPEPQTEPQAEHKPAINPRKESSTRVSIAAQLTPKLLSGLSAALIKTRQEAKAELDKILQSANAIASTGLTPLILALKGRINDPCKALAKGFIATVGHLATSTGQGFKQYAKIIIQPLVANLSEKQLDIRAETASTLDRIASACGIDIILSSMVQTLEGGSAEGKSAALRWVLRHGDELTAGDGKVLATSLVGLAQEKGKESRDLAEQVIGAVVVQLGESVFAPAMRELRPMIKANIEKIINRYKHGDAEAKQREGLQVNRTESMLEEYKSLKVGDDSKIEQSDLVGSSFVVDRGKQKSRMERCKSPLESSAFSSSYVRRQNVPRVGSMSSSRSTNDLTKQFRSVRRVRPQEQKKAARPTLESTSVAESVPNSKANDAATAPAKSGEAEDKGASEEQSVRRVVIATLENKEGRAELEKKTKWPVNQIKKANVDKLKKTLKTCIEATVLEEMFSNQPKKIVAAANAFTAAIPGEYSSLLGLLDLLCKWASTKMLEQVSVPAIKAVLEFLLAMFKAMEEAQYKLLDFEASFIVPMLCERLDTPNLSFRLLFKELLKITARLYNPAKVVNGLMGTLEATKSRKTKIECLGLMKELIKAHDANKIFIPKDIKGLVKLLESSDSHLKAESLDILAEIYNSRGDSLWTLTGKLTEKTTELLKKKFNVGGSGELKKSKRSDSFLGDFFSNSRIRPSQRPSMSRFNETFYEDSMSIATLSNKRRDSGNKEDLLTHSLDKDHLSPSESESLFNATEKLESDISPYIRHKGSQSISSKVMLSSMDNSKFQEEDEVEIAALDQALEILKSEAISKRVNALMYLNEKTMSNLEEEKECLVAHSNKLLLTFAEVLKELFDKPVKDIPIRFTKYFMTVVSKVCANKAVVQNVNEQCFSLFIEQIFMKLLYDGLEIMGSNNEGQYLIKALNLTVLRVLEFYDPTKLFGILVNLFMKYKDISVGNVKMAKLPSLIAKCILKLAKSIPNIVEALNVPKVLLALHEYLLLIPPSALPKSANDDIGIRMGKTIVYELIKARGEGIWEDYRVVELHQKPDLHLRRWIDLILGTHHSSSASFNRSGEEPTTDSSDELQEICQGLNSQQTFQEAIRRLSQYSQEHPDVDLAQYFSVYSRPLREFVLGSLERFNSHVKATGSTSEPRNVLNSSSLSEKSSSASEYKSKLELLKQKFDIGNKEDEGSN